MESEHLITEILFRLPWGSVTRFKSVSKGWCRLISDPFFVRNYQARNRSALGFFYKGNKRMVKFTPSSCQEDLLLKKHIGDFESHPGHMFCLLCSSNGLLLYYSFKYHRDEFDEFYFVRNPIRKLEICVPPPMQQIIMPYRLQLLINYKRTVVHGFACIHSSTPTYFILTELSLIHNPLHVNTFSSKTCKWSRRDYHPKILGGGYPLSGSFTFFNGAFHWLLGHSGILVYNINNEKLFRLSLPGNEDDRYCCLGNPTCPDYTPYICRFLGESQGRLIYIRVAGESKLFFWIVEDYRRWKWSKRYQVILNNLPESLVHNILVEFDPRDAKVVNLYMKKKIVSYHLESGEMKELFSLTEEDGGDCRSCRFLCPYYLPCSRQPIPLQ